LDLHNDHIVLKIDDEESLAKENITLDNEEKDFNINIEKLNNLNKSIENEIIEIDKIYEKVDNDITKAYSSNIYIFD
jgi:predicted  nucleic acid-binding Zn-ribbon protein